MSEASSPSIIETLEKQIEAGELDGGSFHRFVQKEIYPLLASGELSEWDFAELVVKWSRRNYPLGWQLVT